MKSYPKTYKAYIVDGFQHYPPIYTESRDEVIAKLKAIYKHVKRLEVTLVDLDTNQTVAIKYFNKQTWVRFQDWKRK